MIKITKESINPNGVGTFDIVVRLVYSDGEIILLDVSKSFVYYDDMTEESFGHNIEVWVDEEIAKCDNKLVTEKSVNIGPVLESVQVSVMKKIVDRIVGLIKR